MRIQRNQKKRWKAIFTLKHYPNWEQTHYFNEILQLDRLVEDGPDWGELGTITITYELDD